MQKKQLGQFYTHKNIFQHKVFIKWWNNIPKEQKQYILEPFAGKNGIINMLKELHLVKKYSSFDIVPGHEEVKYQDTIQNFPSGFNTVITNPPFLAKNSATRRKLEINLEQHNDLYELCLQKCLDNSAYVAAIVPESFIVSEFPKDRVYAIISLAQRHIFKDTEHPVCLVLFTPTKNEDYLIYKNENLLGKYKKINSKISNFFNDKEHDYSIKYHNPEGNIGLIAIDATDSTKQIRFTYGTNILSEDVNPESRLRTRFSIYKKNGKPLTENQNKKLIEKLNKELFKYRKISNDVTLTAFKGMRNDGSYRRRLDFTTAKKIIDKTLNNF